MIGRRRARRARARRAGARRLAEMPFGSPLSAGAARRRRWPALAAAIALLAGVAAVPLALGGLPSISELREAAGPAGGSGPRAAPGGARFAVHTAPGPLPVGIRFKRPPRAGLLFDVQSGEVLWRRRSRRRLPIASLTKMMTALIVAERHRPREKVRIDAAALNYQGSGIGLLRRGQRVRLETLLNGLLLVSGNDAAIALARHDAGTARRFVSRMMSRARSLGLACTRFNTPHGLRDEGNHSCAEDLAALARADLANRRIARIVRRRQAVLPFPIRGGRLYLRNNNPLIRLGLPRITGLKTGLTRRAGRCYVITARRGGRHLGVVLLHSPDPIRQLRALLRAGARAPRAEE